MTLETARTLVIRRPLDAKGFTLPWLPAAIYSRF